MKQLALWFMMCGVLPSMRGRNCDEMGGRDKGWLGVRGEGTKPVVEQPVLEFTL